MGLIAAQAERCIILNVTTGTKFLAKKSNSHYHVHLRCLTAHSNLVISQSIKSVIQFNLIYFDWVNIFHFD